MANDDISFKIAGDSSDFIDAMQEAKERAAETLAQIQEKVVGVGEAFKTLKETAALFAAAVVGGEVIEKLGQLAERAENIKELAAQFNTTTTTLQGLQVVAAETGVAVVIATHDPTIMQIAHVTYEISDGVINRLEPVKPVSIG